jgi:hypothetical protein
VLQQLALVCKRLLHYAAVILASALLVHTHLVNLVLQQPSLADDAFNLMEVLASNAGVRWEHLANIFDYVSHNHMSSVALQLILRALWD